MDPREKELLQKLFEEKNFKPNENQYKAITYTDGPLFLTAGPGSGKTRVLLWRTLNLIVFQNIQPNEIFLATFTEKAALQLKEGLQGLLSIASQYTHKPYDIAEMYIGTLHSLCQKLLTDRRFSLENARHRKPIILDELDQYFFVSDYDNWNQLLIAGGFSLDNMLDCYSQINEWFGETQNKRSKTNTIKNCISFFNRMSEEDFSDADLKLKDATDTEKALLKMTKKYRELLANEKSEKVDFSSLQQKAFQYISQNLFSNSIFKHVIVDEYQDTNTIQMKIYMQLAGGNQNICVVGDDDQALYRFRGATVENLVDFEDICEKQIGKRPYRIDLNINYRSRKQIVNTYTEFIKEADWKNPSEPKKIYRIQNKNIQANNTDDSTSVLLESGKKEYVVKNIVNLVKKMKETGKIADYNQCALLFPSLKNCRIEKDFEKTFKEANIPFYAPRANNILNTEEFLVVFGLFAKIFNIEANPESALGQGSIDFQNWLLRAINKADEIISTDQNLEDFIVEKKTEIELAKKNYKYLETYCDKHQILLTNIAEQQTPKLLSSTPKLYDKVKKLLLGKRLNDFLIKRNNDRKPLSVGYILTRVTALDWTLLDLFYQLNTFNWFVAKYDKAENGGEDSALYNFGMITNYISKFMEQSNPILSGKSFQENSIQKRFFNSFLYTIFRLGETEYEDTDDPFPKGCVPFITIHQSKGLEFPVVILASCRHTKRDARPLDVITRKLYKEMDKLQDNAEPLDRTDEYDTMRMFYVALSRAKNLLILAQPIGRGQSTYLNLKTYLANHKFPNCEQFDISSLPCCKDKSEEMAHVYTYTGDYLPYTNCPRNYMVFKKYKFVPSRSQTMFFGSLVHQSIEDLQNFINGGIR